jgi:hypothetical protein
MESFKKNSDMYKIYKICAGMKFKELFNMFKGNKYELAKNLSDLFGLHFNSSKEDEMICGIFGCLIPYGDGEECDIFGKYYKYFKDIEVIFNEIYHEEVNHDYGIERIIVIFKHKNHIYIYREKLYNYYHDMPGRISVWKNMKIIE